MKNTFAIMLALLVWFSILGQFYLSIENRIAPVGETIIRFFTYFTILTNIIVALHFTLSSFKIESGFFRLLVGPGALTAVTVYITTVGTSYQVLLRHIWAPSGFQMIIDELLHTVIPILVIVYWYLYESKSILSYRMIPKWVIFPVIYFGIILIRGSMSGFYPYHFVDVATLGLQAVLINSLLLFAFFVFLSVFFVWYGRRHRLA
jgi:hypothetical protein